MCVEWQHPHSQRRGLSTLGQCCSEWSVKYCIIKVPYLELIWNAILLKEPEGMVEWSLLGETEWLTLITDCKKIHPHMHAHHKVILQPANICPRGEVLQRGEQIHKLYTHCLGTNPSIWIVCIVLPAMESCIFWQHSKFHTLDQRTSSLFHPCRCICNDKRNGKFVLWKDDVTYGREEFSEEWEGKRKMG